eukprot:scaffold4761_cov105-Skeletonema_dohrnii-CCMP3373.AAC.2
MHMTLTTGMPSYLRSLELTYSQQSPQNSSPSDPSGILIAIASCHYPSVYSIKNFHCTVGCRSFH